MSAFLFRATLTLVLLYAIKATWRRTAPPEPPIPLRTCVVTECTIDHTHWVIVGYRNSDGSGRSNMDVGVYQACRERTIHGWLTNGDL